MVAKLGCGQIFLSAVLFVVSFMYDMLTLPFYILVQRRRSGHRKPEASARVVDSDDSSITYSSTDSTSALHVELKRAVCQTLDALFEYSFEKYGDKNCLGTRQIIGEEDEQEQLPGGSICKKYVLGDYEWKTYNDVKLLAAQLASGLTELGLKPKDTIAIFAETREEWLLSAIAAFRLNLTLATLYATLGDDAVAAGLNETQVKYVITSHELLPKFKHILNKTPSVETVIYFQDRLHKTDTTGFKSGVKLVGYSEVLAMGEKASGVLGARRSTPKAMAKAKANDIAILMYTSGSTGAPKGVLLSHGNICAAIKGMADSFPPIRQTDRYLAYLPLAHVLELMCESYGILVGAPIGYSSALTMTDRSPKIKRGCQGDASVLKPTVMATVPLMLERVVKAITAELEAGGVLKQTLFNLFYNYKLKWAARGFSTPLVNAFIFQKIRALLGGQVRLMVTGGAPLAPQIHEFARTALCCHVLQGFGLTETCACATVQGYSDSSTGHVGSPLTCCDIRLINWEEGNYRVTDKPRPRGEVLIGGENVGVGYYKNGETTRTKQEFFDENGRRWFKSGDIGEMCEDGVLKIIDRKKDLVKLQHGEYVSVGKVESELKSNAFVDSICVYGDPTQLFVVALVSPVEQQIQALAASLEKPAPLKFEQLCEDADINKEVLKQLQEYGKNAKLDKYELPRALKLVPEKWTPDSGLVTAAFKLRRRPIQEKYQNQINELYGNAKE